MLHVLDVLKTAGYEADKLPEEMAIPDQFLDAFEGYCQKFGLVDEHGTFNNAYKLVEFFCGPTVRKPRAPKKPKASRKTPKRDKQGGNKNHSSQE